MLEHIHINMIQYNLKGNKYMVQLHRYKSECKTIHIFLLEVCGIFGPFYFIVVPSCEPIFGIFRNEIPM